VRFAKLKAWQPHPVDRERRSGERWQTSGPGGHATIQRAAPATVQAESDPIVLFPQMIVPLREVPIPGTTMHRIFDAQYREEAYLTPAAICPPNNLKNGTDKPLPASRSD
jgi:hypothetical protein